MDMGTLRLRVVVGTCVAAVLLVMIGGVLFLSWVTTPTWRQVEPTMADLQVFRHIPLLSEGRFGHPQVWRQDGLCWYLRGIQHYFVVVHVSASEWKVICKKLTRCQE